MRCPESPLVGCRLLAAAADLFPSRVVMIFNGPAGVLLTRYQSYSPAAAVLTPSTVSHKNERYSG
jgi:hypothetical protein